MWYLNYVSKTSLLGGVCVEQVEFWKMYRNPYKDIWGKLKNKR
jgi:hypothetical protein